MPARKIVLLILAVLLAFTAIDVISWYASPASVVYKQSGNVVSLPGDSFQTTDALEPFRSVIYHLDKPLREDSNIMFSYTQEDGTPRLIQRKGMDSASQLVFEIPLARYLYLDCYIDADVRITGVTVSDQPAGRVHAVYQPDFVRILVPSAVLAALILLFTFVRPLNQVIKTVDQKIIDPETRYKGVTIAYIVFAVTALLHHIYVTLYHKYVLTGGTDLATGIPLLIFAGVTVLLGRLWKDKLFWIFLALFWLKLLDTALQVGAAFPERQQYFIIAAYAFFGCYGVARVLRREDWKTFFSVLCPLWVLAAVVLAAFGIYVACTGVPVKNLGSEQFVISGGRIYFAYHPVTSGILLSTAMSVALFGCALARGKVLRIYYVVCAVILFLAGSLTGTRVVYVLSGMQLACMLCLTAYDRLRPGEPKAPLKTAGKWIALAALFVAVTSAVAFLQSYTPEVFSVVRSRGALVSVAAAEDAAAEVSRRGFQISVDPDVTFTGRFTIWKNAWNIITSNPRNLVFGQPVYATIAMGSDMWAEQGLVNAYHCHNTVLQTLFENGIPGVLLFLAFLVLFVVHAVRVLLNRDLPFWQRLLPLPVICGLTADLLDSTCHVNFGYPQMTLLYLFAGFTIALSLQVKKQSASRKP